LDLPPRADAVAVVHGQRVLLLGGRTPEGPTAAVHAVSISAGKLTAEVWPELPLAGPPAGAAILQNRLYVLAGPAASRDASPAAETALWSLDLAQPADGWRVEAALPAAPRARPLLAAQHGGLHVLGGETVSAEGFRSLRSDAWVFLPRPREASVLLGWQNLPPLPVPAAAGAAWPAGQASLILHAETDTGPRLLLFNAVTDGWAELPAHPLPPGSVAVAPPSAQLALAPAAAGTAPALHTIVPARYARTLGTGDYLVIAAYFVAMAAIGFYFGRKQETAEEFTLGGRKVKWWAAGLSMFATGASSISFLAIPAMAYQTNAIWILPLSMMFVAFFLQGWVIFPLLRRLQITSTFEYLERRFGVSLRLIASAQAILFQTIGRTTVVLVLPAMALSATTGIDVVWSVVIMGLLTTVYTAVGGFEAVIWTDVVQGLMMLLTPIIVVILVANQVPGGFAGGWTLLSENHKFTLALPTWDYALPAAWILCMAALFQHTVNLAGDQPVIQRVFSTPLPVLRRTSATYIVCGFVIGILVNAIGFALYVYFHHYPEQLLLGSTNDQVLPAFLVTALPTGLAGLIIAAVFAAAMSTVSSSMNSVATLLHQDFYQRFRPHATPAQNLRFLKTNAYAVGLLGTGVAAYMATLQITSMFALWNTILGLLGGGIVGLYSLGMFTRRANTAGAIFGAAASVAWSLWLKSTGAHFMLYLPSSVLVCMAAGYVASLALPGRPRDLTGLTVFTPATPASVRP
jgi:SSS family transporter